jgi:hypothetical protein
MGHPELLEIYMSPADVDEMEDAPTPWIDWFSHKSLQHLKVHSQ